MRNLLTIIILLFACFGSISAQVNASRFEERRARYEQDRNARMNMHKELSEKDRETLESERIKRIRQAREVSANGRGDTVHRPMYGSPEERRMSYEKRREELLKKRMAHDSSALLNTKRERPDLNSSHGPVRRYTGSRSSMQSKTLYFNPNIETFVRDAEYFLPYTKGYTALGFFLNPTFIYVHDAKISASVGLHMVGIAGDHDKIRDLSPIVSLEYKPIPNVRIVGGTLDNSTSNHAMGEPMFDYDRKFYAPKEDGLQIFVDTKFWESEMWCNWEDFIVVDSPWQEKFTFGWHNRVKFNLDKTSRNVLSIPLDLMMNHRGGQIDAVQDTCIETLANFSAGLRFEHKFAKSVFLTINLPYYGFSNRSNDEHIHTHFKEGYGLYPQISLAALMRAKKHSSFHTLSGSLGYWFGDGFVSGRGSYLFQSRSYFDDAFTRRYRHMLTPSLSYDLSKTLNVLLQAYCDLDESKTDFAATISLKFGNDFKIHSLRPGR